MLDLVEILKNCPKGTKLYLATIGCEVRLCWARLINRWPIRVIADEQRIYDLTRHGCVDEAYPNGECVLFPSKTQRDWSKFNTPVKKFNPKTLKPFDRVIAKLNSEDIYYWFADFVSMPAKGYDIVPCIISKKEAEMVIPYNEETKHLVGTSDEAPEYYRYWED